MSSKEVAEQWDAFKVAIQSLMPADESNKEEQLNNLLVQITNNKMQCWTVTIDGKIKAALTTIIVYDPTGQRNLLVYSLFGYAPVSMDQWLEAFYELERWGKSRGCSAITAYTDNPRVTNILKRVGAKMQVYASYKIREEA
jgi:hypothetical protein